LTYFICLDQNKKAKNTLSSNSNLFEWTWLRDGPMEGYILGREIPNIGKWTQFSPARIANLQKNKIKIPKPTVSAHTVPKSQWIVSIPNTSGNKINYTLGSFYIYLITTFFQFRY
jgi:hypothetical protein